MGDEPFEGTSFSASDSPDPTNREFIDFLHDPDILYYYIEDAYNKAQQDLTIDTDGKDIQVDIHANVEVFQSAIQYVEAFGIYLTAYIKNREELVENLIKTNPGEVGEFFEAVSNDETSDWLAGEGITDDLDTTLEKVYGYAYAEPENIQRDGEVVTQEELDEAIERSINLLTTEISTIGEFYTTFHPIYNAVKHGNRAIPQESGHFELSPNDGDQSSITLGSDMNFVMFVCKNQNGEPYLAGLPIDYLVEHAIGITRRTHRLFKQLKRVSKAAITEEGFELSFYTSGKGTGESANQESNDSATNWFTARFASGILILPRIPEIEEWISRPVKRTSAAKLEFLNGNLTVHTDNTDTVSEEYPIETTITQAGFVGLSPQPILNFNVSFSLKDLDAHQYHEVLKFKDAIQDGRSISITTIDDSTDSEFQIGTQEGFPSLAVPEFLPREEIKQIALLQTITQRRLPVPLDLSNEQRAIVQTLIEENPTREEAITAVDELEQLGNKREVTLYRVEKRTPEDELLEETLAAVAKGTMEFTVTLDETGESWTSTEEEEMRLPLAITEKHYGEVVTELQNDINTAERYLRRIPETPEDHKYIGMKAQAGVLDDNFWGRVHELTFQVIGSPHEHPPQSCPLCGMRTRNLANHFLTTLHSPI